jgi:hypothetical protein
MVDNDIAVLRFVFGGANSSFKIELILENSGEIADYWIFYERNNE